MTTELVEIRIGDRDHDLFVARPDGAGPHPAVLICHAWGGRKDFEEDRARRLAELGYIGVSFEAARGLGGVDPQRVGAIGFCFGGLCALLAARMGLPRGCPAGGTRCGR